MHIFDGDGNEIADLDISEKQTKILELGEEVVLLFHTPQLLRSLLGESEAPTSAEEIAWAFRKLLEVHFATHDPTSLNRQGNDVGTQYRSTIFYANEEEKKIAQDYIAELNNKHVYDKPIVTTLEPLKAFYPAETYHQNYVCQNPNQGYVRAVALPKVDKVRHKFADDLKEKSPLEKK